MDQEKPLSELKVAIIGLGLIGGSLALALQGKCKKMIGVDNNNLTIKLASEMNVFDAVFSTYPEDFSEFEVVILAVPVGTIIQVIWELPYLHHGKAVIFDLGSTKSQIMAAMQELPHRFETIGGHPMCGKEKSSILNAEPGLFKGSMFVLSSIVRTTENAKKIAEQIVRKIGSVPLWLDAETNDRWTATTSHLPYLISNALTAITPVEYHKLAGPGFRSTARLSGSPISMMMDILGTNRENVLESLKVYTQRLELIHNLLNKNDVSQLVKTLGEGEKKYHELLEMNDAVINDG